MVKQKGKETLPVIKFMTSTGKGKRSTEKIMDEIGRYKRGKFPEAGPTGQNRTGQHRGKKPPVYEVLATCNRILASTQV